ncbi:hypothetical protein AB6D66_00285 [Vibrio pomeroyi]|uniref:Uncharacterized protein n=1 Tax=Vibrio pomeroyi TaxID=198832 RepID=A0ABV4MQR5_9VIBR|nr:hypothetical protein [Vibrio atlanticus]MCZ4310985.1 hypothetical protein [Vibrio atlanticus]
MFLIRDYGNDTECANGEELVDTLSSKYKDNSVSIQYATKATGMLAVHFVDIDAQGSITDSYGDEAPFDLSLLESKARPTLNN